MHYKDCDPRSSPSSVLTLHDYLPRMNFAVCRYLGHVMSSAIMKVLGTGRWANGVDETIDFVSDSP